MDVSFAKGVPSIFFIDYNIMISAEIIVDFNLYLRPVVEINVYVPLVTVCREIELPTRYSYFYTHKRPLIK